MFVIATLAVPRRWALIPLVLLISLVPTGQRVVIANIDFAFMRLAIVALAARALLRSETGRVPLTALTWVMIAQFTLPILAGSIRGSGSIVTFIGYAGDYGLLFLLGRTYIRGKEDLLLVGRVMSFVFLGMIFFFAFEKSTGRNFFSELGGVRPITAIRDGELRCQGPFAHPIIAGVYVLAFIPAIGMQFFQFAGRRQLMGAAGILAAVTLIFFTGSSTPLGAAIITLAVMLVWKRRRIMPNLIRFGLLFGLLIHIAAPTGLHGFLFTRVSIFSGSTGIHRYRLIQGAIDNFGSWALFGGTSNSWGWGLDDVTCEYIAVALRGGALSLLLFLVGLIIAHCALVRAGAFSFRQKNPYPFVVWVSLFSLLVCGIGVSFFGQSVVPFYLLLGAVDRVLGESKMPRPVSSAARRGGDRMFKKKIEGAVVSHA